MAPAFARSAAQTGVPGAILDTYQYTTVAIGVINSGNADLTPEEADTLTFGFVFKPEFDKPLFSDLSLSVDWYDIDIRQRHRADCRRHRVEQVLQPRRHQSDLRSGQPVSARPCGAIRRRVVSTRSRRRI